MKKGIGVALALAFIFMASTGAAPMKASSVDLQAVKQSIEVYEGILTTVLQQNFVGPFAILEKPKGVYLDGYGAVFNFEVDMSSGKQQTLFSPTRPTTQEERKAFDEKLPKLKGVMIKALADYADSLKAVKPEDHIALVAQLFSVGILTGPAPLRTLVIRTSKANVLDFKAGRLSLEDFKKKLEITQY